MLGLSTGPSISAKSSLTIQLGRVRLPAVVLLTELGCCDRKCDREKDLGPDEDSGLRANDRAFIL